MTKPIDFFWFIPTSGDGAYLGASDLSRGPDYPYLREIAVAVDRLGYKGVLLPTGVACEESFVMAAALAAATQRLKFLVAIRPGVASPAYYARLSSTLDRVSNGRLLLNIVVGGNPAELAGDGVFLAHDERYGHAEEFFTVFEELLAKGEADPRRRAHQGDRRAARLSAGAGAAAAALLRRLVGRRHRFRGRARRQVPDLGRAAGGGRREDRQGARRRGQGRARRHLRHPPALHRPRDRRRGLGGGDFARLSHRWGICQASPSSFVVWTRLPRNTSPPFSVFRPGGPEALAPGNP